jgi:hypothetical protein
MLKPPRIARSRPLLTGRALESKICLRRALRLLLARKVGTDYRSKRYFAPMVCEHLALLVKSEWPVLRACGYTVTGRLGALFP